MRRQDLLLISVREVCHLLAVEKWSDRGSGDDDDTKCPNRKE
jgi:hypothetical protein